MKRVAAVVAVIIVVGVAAFGLSFLSRGFSARREPGSAETYIARRLRRIAMPSGSRDAKNPVAGSPEVLAGAMEHFADHCATCHGNDGLGKTMIGDGLYPKPPDMTQAATQDLTDGEIYYIIENGIRFTGMPAFGEETGEQDNETWALVHFIRHLPSMTAGELEAMEKMNPKSPMDLQQEEEERKFLNGDDSPPAPGSHEHHH